MQSERIENALGAILQHIPETKQEASRMTTEQWAAFQNAATMCNALFEEMSGAICHNGTWILVGRQAAELVNNAAGALIVTLERAIESGSVPKKLLLALVEKLGLDATQELVVGRITALWERAEALRLEVENGGGSVNMLFEDDFAKETGNWPRPASYGVE
jgi:hypothetical protein